MTRSRVTSHDVARAAGVSRTTVSIVLNRSNSAVIGEDTRKRVEAAVSAPGFESLAVQALPACIRFPI